MQWESRAATYDMHAGLWALSVRVRVGLVSKPQRYILYTVASVGPRSVADDRGSRNQLPMLCVD